MDRTEQLATILAVTRVKSRRLTQPDRVQRLLLTGDPAAVLSEIVGLTLIDDPVLERARDDVELWLERGC